MSPTYKQVALNALTETTEAIARARFCLPSELIRDYNIAKNHAADPWNSIKHAYATAADRDPEVMAILVDLVELSHAAAKLKNVVEGKPLPPVESLNLQLARTRRAS